MKTMVREIHLAVCGDTSLGVSGLVAEMKHTKIRVSDLEKIQTLGLGAWKIIGILCGVVVGTAGVTLTVVEITQALHH